MVCALFWDVSVGIDCCFGVVRLSLCVVVRCVLNVLSCLMFVVCCSLWIDF